MLSSRPGALNFSHCYWISMNVLRYFENPHLRKIWEQKCFNNRIKITFQHFPSSSSGYKSKGNFSYEWRSAGVARAHASGLRHCPIKLQPELFAIAQGHCSRSHAHLARQVILTRVAGLLMHIESATRIRCVLWFLACSCGCVAGEHMVGLGDQLMHFYCSLEWAVAFSDYLWGFFSHLIAVWL